MIEFGVVTHGGVGTEEDLSDGCKTACEAAFRMLEGGKGAIDAAVEACMMLEDDGRFNAGSGSALRIDGETVEMDAAVMDSEGSVGAVINIRNVKNPVYIAQALTATPHVALAGRGAEAFARKIGAKPFAGVSARAVERFHKTMRLLEEGRIEEVNPRWKEAEKFFSDKISSDTVGAVALDRRGTFAVAASTGGASPMMVGRVGDTPMIGCGFYAGPVGAFAATGIGEEIIKKMLAKTVYDFVYEGEDVDSAGRKGIGLFEREIPVGLVGISGKGFAVFANRSIAHYAMVRGD